MAEDRFSWQEGDVRFDPPLPDPRTHQHMTSVVQRVWVVGTNVAVELRCTECGQVWTLVTNRRVG